MVDKLYTPWDLDTVKSLKAVQSNDTTHGYTCENHSTIKLVPTYSGWVCVVSDCDYTQDWALVADLSTSKEKQ